MKFINKKNIIVCILIISVSINFLAIESLQKVLVNILNMLSYLSNDFSAFLGIFGSVFAVYVGFKLSNQSLVNIENRDITLLISMLEYICRMINLYELPNNYMDGLRQGNVNCNLSIYTSLVYIGDWYKYVTLISDINDRDLITRFIVDVQRGAYYINKVESLNKVQEITNLLKKYK